MEKVKNTMSEWHDAEYVKNRIEAEMNDYILDPKNEIENITKLSQLQYDALLMHIGNKLFKNTYILRYDNKKDTYDIDKVNILVDIYIMYASKYNKVVSIQSFSYFSSIDTVTLSEWLYNSHGDRNNPELSNARRNLTKKLIEARENGLKGKLTSSNQAVGIIAIGNSEFGWSSDTIAKEERARSMALTELPTLDARPLELSQNLTQFKLENNDV